MLGKFMPHPNIPGGYKSEEERQRAMAIPPQFMKKAQAKSNPVADAKKKVAAQRLAKMKSGVKDTDKDGK